MVRPHKPIRRFDIFAEYNRQKLERAGMPADEAKGYALWVAKSVASRRERIPVKAGGAPEEEPVDHLPHLVGKWRSLQGEPQTDQLFDDEIVQRMGTDFYHQVFVPAIQKALVNGIKYADIRDSLRRDWNQ